MKILLVEPHLGIKRTWLYRFVYYRSLALEQIAALTPPEHDVEIIEEKFQDVNFNKEYDLVGISCLTCNVIRGYEIADKFRRRNVKVVLGGYHPTALPNEAKQHADSVVLGEAELTWSELLKDFENGTLKPFYQPINFVDPKNIPAPKRSKFRNPMYESIQATRGCPNQCKFCAMQKVEGSIFRPRPISNVIDEIQGIKCKNLFFVDSSMTLNPSYSKSLFQEMKELNKRFECFGNINVLARDNELLKIASDAGCYRWLVGIESISQETINTMSKYTNKVEKYATAIKNIKDHNMMVTGLFMFGFDGDTSDVFNKTLDAMNKWDLDYATFSILTPYPGTPLSEQLKRENRITSYDWYRYTEGNVNFKPKNMTEEQLLEGIKKAASEYYSFSNSLRRCIGSNNLSIPIFKKKVVRNFFSTRLFNKELFEY